MKQDSINKIVAYFSQTMLEIANGLEDATRGNALSVESYIKASYYGLDNALTVARREIAGVAAAYNVERFKSPVARNTNTILGYLADHHPGTVLADDFDPIEHTKRDGFALMNRCKADGHVPEKVPAPPCLAEYGITEVNAYPYSYLEARLA